MQLISRDNWLIALITSGEAGTTTTAYPTSARHGLASYEFDLSWIQIRMLKFFGIAKSVRVARLGSEVAVGATVSGRGDHDDEWCVTAL